MCEITLLNDLQRCLDLSSRSVTGHRPRRVTWLGRAARRLRASSAPQEQSRHDVIVVGAGVAGSVTAMLLARQGRRVLLVDRSPVSARPYDVAQVGPAGVLLLERWGLLDRLIGKGCATASSVWLSDGDRTFQLRHRICFPLRRALRVVLLQAASDSGVVVRTGFTVRDLVWQDDRVAGVVGTGTDERAVCEHAHIVIGADGRHSTVARAAGAYALHAEPSHRGEYSAGWDGVDCRAPALYTHDGAAVLLLPSGDHGAWVVVSLPVEAWARYKRATEVTYRAGLARASSVADRLAGARRSTRFYGTADLDACVRRSAGPGWRLVGDASRHAGGAFSYGDTHCLIQSELLASALDGGVASYEARSDAILREMESLSGGLPNRVGEFEEAAVRQLRQVLSPS